MEVFNVNTSKELSDKQLLRCWQVIVPWLADRAKRYHILCEQEKEGSPQVIDLLTKHALTREEVSKKVKTKFFDALLKAISKDYRTPNIVFHGLADRDFVNILLFGPLPDESLPADIAPCQQIILYRNDEVLFSSYDYGVFQTLFLYSEEVQELKNLLKKANLPQEILVKQTNKKTADKASWFFMGRVC